MLFVLITSAKVVQKAKPHYTINNICSTILINHKLFVHLLHEIRESPPKNLHKFLSAKRNVVYISTSILMIIFADRIISVQDDICGSYF